jgi:hypothetical protein
MSEIIVGFPCCGTSAAGTRNAQSDSYRGRLARSTEAHLPRQDGVSRCRWTQSRGAASTGSEPIELLMENEEYFRSYRIDYHGGERYPHLERVDGKPDVLGEIAKMRTPAVTAGTD